jgi:hypothetical protein
VQACVPRGRLANFNSLKCTASRPRLAESPRSPRLTSFHRSVDSLSSYAVFLRVLMSRTVDSNTSSASCLPGEVVTYSEQRRGAHRGEDCRASRQHQGPLRHTNLPTDSVGRCLATMTTCSQSGCNTGTHDEQIVNSLTEVVAPLGVAIAASRRGSPSTQRAAPVYPRQRQRSHKSLIR